MLIKARRRDVSLRRGEESQRRECYETINRSLSTTISIVVKGYNYLLLVVSSPEYLQYPDEAKLAVLCHGVLLLQLGE